MYKAVTNMCFRISNPASSVVISAITKDIVGVSGFRKPSSVPVFCACAVQTVTAIPSVARRIRFSFIDDAYCEAFVAILDIT